MLILFREVLAFVSLAAFSLTALAWVDVISALS